MRTKVVLCVLISAAACTTPERPDRDPRAAAQPPEQQHARPPTAADDVLPVRDDAVGPHPKFASDWRVHVREPLEVQVSPCRFSSAGASDVLLDGTRSSRWPILGAIAAHVDRR